MKSSKIMFGYAIFVVVCSCLAFALAPDKSRATTALYAGGGAGVLIAICALMARQVNVRRTIGMIGIHVGMVLPLLFAFEFGRRSAKNFVAADGKMYLAVIFAALTIGSVAAFIAVLISRPKATERGA
jgi:dipeptide/tripeptide permease